MNEADMLVYQEMHLYRDQHNGHFPACILVYPQIYREMSVQYFEYMQLPATLPTSWFTTEQDMSKLVEIERNRVPVFMMDPDRTRLMAGTRVKSLGDAIVCLDVVQMMDMLKIQETLSSSS